jgi:hypothetical protein
VFDTFVPMNAIVTVFKEEFKGKENTLKTIELLCDHLSEVAQAIIIIPKGGKLINVLNVLNDNKIAYGTHFNTAPGALPSIK